MIIYNFCFFDDVIVFLISQNADAIPFLATFVQHFSDRFIQIASSDIDDNVALAMIEAMRSMQR